MGYNIMYPTRQGKTKSQKIISKHWYLENPRHWLFPEFVWWGIVLVAVARMSSNDWEESESVPVSSPSSLLRPWLADWAPLKLFSIRGFLKQPTFQHLMSLSLYWASQHIPTKIILKYFSFFNQSISFVYRIQDYCPTKDKKIFIA